MDFTLGLYGFFTSFVLFNILFFAYTKYKDPYFDAASIPISSKNMDSIPLFSIVVPVKNEEENIRNCVQSCINQSYPKKEIIIINDGSTDRTAEILDEMRREEKAKNSDKQQLRILHLSRSVGKKKAIEFASQISKGEIYAFMDSDCDMAYDAVERAAKIFISDPQLGALTSHGRVRGAHSGNILEKFQDVYIDGSCRAIKAEESSFSSVTCCSGSLSFYKREAIQHFIHEWAHDTFLGMDFKFCTDRRMTAYVLSTRPGVHESSIDKSSSKGKNSDALLGRSVEGEIPILATGNDEMELLQKTTDPDREYDKRATPPRWNVKYSYSIKVNVGVPNTLSALIQQQIRWKKSFIRSISSTGGSYWCRPSYVAMLYYIQTAMKFLRPYLVLHALIILPLEGDFRSTILWVMGIMYTGMIYAVDFRLRNPGDKLWLYRPVFTFLTTFVYTWLLPVAAVTLRNKSWR
jgi:cellulose synthase/poly-beta-1,6-N-acetylglucosamine synthase-like glycosyltransferase